MDLEYIFKGLLFRWKVVACCTAAFAFLAILVVLFFPPFYKSTASVVAVVRAPETIGPQSVIEQLSPDYVLTLEDILKSDRVAEQVVQYLPAATKLDLSRKYEWTPAQGTLDDFIARNLELRLSLESSLTNSRVMEISYYSQSPEFAAGMANAFAQAFIEVNLDLQSSSARRTIASYNRQLDDMGQKMHDLQADLAVKERELGVVASKGDLDPDAARLGALSTNLASVQMLSADAAARGAGGALPDAMLSPVVQSLQSDLAKLEGQRRQLAVDAGPNNPGYQQIVSQIAGEREQLAKEEDLVRQSAATKAAQARMTQQNISGAVDAERAQVIQSRANQNKVALMQQDLANLSSSYDQITQRRAQLEVLDNTAQTNIELLAPAVIQPKPVFPRPLLTIVGGTVLGFLLGLMSAFLLEITDQRIRVSRQIEGWLGIPDLGSVRLHAVERLRLVRFVSGLLPGSG